MHIQAHLLEELQKLYFYTSRLGSPWIMFITVIKSLIKVSDVIFLSSNCNNVTRSEIVIRYIRLMYIFSGHEPENFLNLVITLWVVTVCVYYFSTSIGKVFDSTDTLGIWDNWHKDSIAASSWILQRIFLLKSSNDVLGTSIPLFEPTSKIYTFCTSSPFVWADICVWASSIVVLYEISSGSSAFCFIFVAGKINWYPESQLWYSGLLLLYWIHHYHGFFSVVMCIPNHM